MRDCPNCGSSEHDIVMTEGKFKITKCKNCSLVYLLNVPDESVIYEDYYKIDFKRSDYKRDSSFDHLSEIYIINEQRLEFLRKLKPGGKLLDVGCGSGLFMDTAKRYGYDVYGIDVSRTAIHYTRNEMGLDAEKKDLDELISEGKTFDIITLWHVLEHFINPMEELKKIHRLLNEDGLCLIEVPNLNSIKFKLAKQKWKGGNHPLYHRTFWTEDTLKRTLEKSGFGTNKRLRISYELPGKGTMYNASKKLSNVFAMDAFLDAAAWK